MTLHSEMIIKQNKKYGSSSYNGYELIKLTNSSKWTNVAEISGE